MPRSSTAPLRDTLDRAAWINAALDLLAAEGVAAVRVEVLAKRMGVTKGSFYWHFEDRQDLLDAVLEEWRRATTTRVVEALLGSARTPRQRLHKLWRICFSGRNDNPGGPLETAIREWAGAADQVAAAMRAVDSERLAFVTRLYADMNAPNPAAMARLFYAYVVGRNLISGRDGVELPAGPTERALLLADE